VCVRERERERERESVWIALTRHACDRGDDRRSNKRTRGDPPAAPLSEH
jgi:hypothetical protein